jgi:hypothetical protein
LALASGAGNGPQVLGDGRVDFLCLRHALLGLNAPHLLFVQLLFRFSLRLSDL